MSYPAYVIMITIINHNGNDNGDSNNNINNNDNNKKAKKYCNNDNVCMLQDLFITRTQGMPRYEVSQTETLHQSCVQ